MGDRAKVLEPTLDLKNSKINSMSEFEVLWKKLPDFRTRESKVWIKKILLEWSVVSGFTAGASQERIARGDSSYGGLEEEKSHWQKGWRKIWREICDQKYIFRGRALINRIWEIFANMSVTSVRTSTITANQYFLCGNTKKIINL